MIGLQENHSSLVKEGTILCHISNKGNRHVGIYRNGLFHWKTAKENKAMLFLIGPAVH